MTRWIRVPGFFSLRDADALVQARRIGEREGEDRGVLIGQRMALNDLRQMLDEYEERLRRVPVKGESDG